MYVSMGYEGGAYLHVEAVGFALEDDLLRELPHEADLQRDYQCENEREREREKGGWNLNGPPRSRRCKMSIGVI